MLNYKVILNAWDKFFFNQAPTYNLSFFRIVWGSLIFLYLLIEFGNVADFYGPEAIASLDVVNKRLGHFHFSLFNLFPNTLASAYGIYFFTLISVFLVTIGLFTKGFLLASLVGIVSLNMRNVWLLSSADILIRSVFLILLWSPCYHVLSVDSWLAKRKGRPLPVISSQWTWRMLQIQISVVYLWTFWAKLKGDNWFDGSAVYYATRLETMRNFTIPWILDQKIIIMLSTWLTLIIECSLGTLVWFRKFRTPVVISGIILHLGIEFTMAIPFFEWVMIALLMNYYNPAEYLRFYQYCRSYLLLKIKRIKGHETFKLKLIGLLKDDERNI